MFYPDKAKPIFFAAFCFYPLTTSILDPAGHYVVRSTFGVCGIRAPEGDVPGGHEL